MAPAAGQGRSTVAVGYDGSEGAQRAVRWAAEYAAALQSPLRVIHAWVWPVFTKKLGPVKGVEGSGLRHSAETILAEGVELARQAYRPPAAVRPAGTPDAGPVDAGGTDVDGVMEAGLPAPVLRSAARDARLLVVGSRGASGLLSQLAGSVCLDLAGSSPCPLMVIRRPHIPGSPVVVGVDATPRSSAAVAGAVRLATALGTSLQLIHINQARGGDRDEHGKPPALQGQELLDRAMAEARQLAPALAVSSTLVQGRAASKELLAVSGDADALVIGTHNREGGPGNTVSAVLHKAHCNVLITR